MIALLQAKYGLQRHGNYRNAFWELVFILISVRTTQTYYAPVFKELKARFPSIEKVGSGRLSSIELILRPAGLSNRKAKQIRIAARSINNRFGPRGLTEAGRKDPIAIEKHLRDLPGVGIKVAKCVMMYACDAEVLPVDTHVWRVMSRFGYAPGGRLTQAKALKLESMIEPSLRFAVHVLCISHGRAICRKKPLCALCPISQMCPSSTEP
jgi:endonuclease-3